MNWGSFSGHITQDLEKKFSTKGVPYCAVAVATDVPGEAGKTMGTTFLDFRVFGPRAEALMRHCCKGTRIWVSYHLETHRWTTRQGEKRKDLQISVKSIEWDPRKESP